MWLAITILIFLFASLSAGARASARARSSIVKGFVDKKGHYRKGTVRFTEPKPMKKH